MVFMGGWRGEIRATVYGDQRSTKQDLRPRRSVHLRTARATGGRCHGQERQRRFLCPTRPVASLAVQSSDRGQARPWETDKDEDAQHSHHYTRASARARRRGSHRGRRRFSRLYGERRDPDGASRDAAWIRAMDADLGPGSAPVL